jgi:naphthoate synthase
VIEWQRSGPQPAGDHCDVPCDTAEGIAKITISPSVMRNAFRATTAFDLSPVPNAARDDPGRGVIILTRPEDKACCPSDDRGIRGAGYADDHPVARLGVLDLQVPTRPRPPAANRSRHSQPACLWRPIAAAVLGHCGYLLSLWQG